MVDLSSSVSSTSSPALDAIKDHVTSSGSPQPPASSGSVHQPVSNGPADERRQHGDIEGQSVDSLLFLLGLSSVKNTRVFSVVVARQHIVLPIPSIRLSVYPSVRPSVRLSVCPSLPLSVSPSIRPSVYPSVRLRLSLCPMPVL